MLEKSLRTFVKKISNFHVQGSKPNILFFSTPRSGSTWLMELIVSQQGMKECNEPFNLRLPVVRKNLGIDDWETLCTEAALEKVEPYLQLFVSGSKKVADFDLLPYQRHHKFFTNRIVFKLLFIGEDRINWFRDTFNAKIIFSIRHPIPVSLSRIGFPRLNAFINTEYRENFTPEQIEFAKEIAAKGSKLEQGVVDWCFQNAPPLQNPPDDMMIITYEQLVLEPETVIYKLTKHLDLDNVEKMVHNISKPSKSVSLSNPETAALLNDASNYENNKKMLLEKWRKKVQPEEEEKLMHILKVFDMDIYVAGDLLPHQKYWINNEQLIKT